MSFEIKDMTEKYVRGFGYVLYTAWEETYRGLMPDSLLDGHSLERCIDIAKTDPHNKYVALSDDKVVGVIAFLPQARDFVSDKNSGEIVALYVLKEYQKQGIGKALMNNAFKDISLKKITLFVLKGNENAIEFYKHMGFEFTGKELEETINNQKIYELEMIKR